MRSLKECVSVLLAVGTHPQPRHPCPVDLEEAMRPILGERAAEESRKKSGLKHTEAPHILTTAPAI